MRYVKVLFLSFFLFISLSSSFAQSIQQAEEFFKKGLFQEALQQYDETFKTTTDVSLKWKSFFKACESLAHLYRWQEVAQRLVNIEMPQQVQQRMRVLIFKTEMLRNFSMLYSFIQARDEMDDKTKDLIRLTPEQLDAMILESYQELWLLKEDLVQIPIKGDDFFVQDEPMNLGAYPTVFDYVVFRWIDFILSKEAQNNDQESLEKAIVLEPLIRQDIDKDSSLWLLALQLMEVASQFHMEKRLEACERWRIERMVFPFKHNISHLFYEQEDRQRVKDILLSWMNEFKTMNAKAQAGYEAAKILHELKQYGLVVALCDEIEKSFSQTDFSVLSRNLRKTIQTPSLQFKTNKTSSSQKESLQITTKNVKEVYVRLFPIKWEDVEQENRISWRAQIEKTFLHHEKIKEYIQQGSFAYQWVLSMEEIPTYEFVSKDLDLSNVEYGMYVVLMSDQPSFDLTESLITQGIINITDLVVLGTSGSTLKMLRAKQQYFQDFLKQTIEDKSFRLYVFDAKTGKTVDDVESYIKVEERKIDQELFFNEQGVASFSLNIDIEKMMDERFYQKKIDVLSKKDQQIAYWGNPLWQHEEVSSMFDIVIQTDRPIYRPGQKVHAKIIVTQQTQDGFGPPVRGQEVDVTAYDVNRESFFSQKVLLNDFGTASVSFDIPQGKLLGNYMIDARYDTQSFWEERRAVGFSVEEYQRPEFEVSLFPSDQVWKYEKPVVIKGDVKYYFGGAVANAFVKYRIKRQRYIPRCFYYWNFFVGRQEEVLQGETTTDERGEFHISFTPAFIKNEAQNSKVPDMSTFIVEVESRDAGGRTMTAQQSYRAGDKAFYFALTPQKNFFIEGEKVVFDVLKQTMNDEGITGNSSYEIYTLSFSDTTVLKNKGSLDVQWKELKNDVLVKSGSVQHDTHGKAQIILDSLSQGAYRFIQKAIDDWGQEVQSEKVFIVVNDRGEDIPFYMNEITIFDKNEYVTGEKAKVLFGSSEASTRYVVEFYAGEYFLRNDVIDTNRKIQMMEVPLMKEMKGVLIFRWFGVKDFRMFIGEANVFVGWPEKKLSIVLPLSSKILVPGQEATWNVKVYNDQGQEQMAEILALMYDRSLEYYKKQSEYWINSLYETTGRRPYRRNNTHSLFDRTGIYFMGARDVFRRWREENVNQLEIFSSPVLYINLGLRELLDYEPYYVASSLQLAGGAERSAKSVDAVSMFDQVDSKERSIAQEVSKKEPVRSDFSETAFFFPHLMALTQQGATITFKAPEQLTSWKVKLFALTKDRKEGALIEEVVTKKDLMVRIDIPRFFREKDMGTVTAMIHNESDRLMSGKLVIDVMDEGSSVSDIFKMSDREKEFLIEPHQMQSFDWKIVVPQGVKVYTIRVFAKTDDMSDAEERKLIVLPSRQQLIASHLTSFLGNETKDLFIQLKDDETRENELMTLEIDPQIALSLLQAVPFLVNYPYECVEQLVNKYVPLAIMSQLYQQYPKIQRVVKQMEHRVTPVSSWEEKDSQRLMTLMETPWGWESKGQPTTQPIVDLLQPQIVEQQKKRVFEKLISAQLSDGSFSWFPSGQGDFYMTLYVLDGFSQAKHYGVEVPTDVIHKALKYIFQTMTEKVKDENFSFAFIAYAGYVVSSFFDDTQNNQIKVTEWAELLEKNIEKLLPLSKAHLGYMYFRLGKHSRANEILDMIMDGVTQDPIVGTYWAPERYAWVWYSDTVEKHAFFLKMLQEFRPNDVRIAGMVKWLLFNRKGNVWKSTRASAAAIYALLTFLNERGGLEQDEKFNIQWGKEVLTAQVSADGVVDRPLRWQKIREDIKKEDARVVIQKEGPGVAFAHMTWIYSTDQIAEASQEGVMNVERKFYRRVKEEDRYVLKPLQSGDVVDVGDQIEVQLKINTKSSFEYVHLKDVKAAGFEAETLLSGWQYDKIVFYQEQRDSVTNFFIEKLPQGEYIMQYRLKPTKAGVYRIGSAMLQSMYAPEMTAYSTGFLIEVK